MRERQAMVWVAVALGLVTTVGLGGCSARSLMASHALAIVATCVMLWSTLNLKRQKR